jgi:predicted ATP-dependent serine protease
MKISDTELKGLAGIAGISTPQNNGGNPFESSDVVSSLDLQKAIFRHMGFTGIWKKIIGDPEEPFHVMIYGPGGKGKSTFSIKFAAYLSKHLNRNGLYIADEEKISSKLKEKLQLFDSYNKNLAVTGKMPKSLKKFEVVFIDSVTSMGMEPEELEGIQEQYPNTCFIYILQTNKQGSFYGKKKWEHLCGVVLRFEDGTVKVDKNRFGKVGEYEVG